MDFQPPANANKLEDFLPPGVQLRHFNTPPGHQVKANLNRGRGDGLAYANDKVAVIMERNSAPNRTDLDFTLISTTPLTTTTTSHSQLAVTAPVTTTEIITEPLDSHIFYRFDIELTENDQPGPELDKQVRIVVDLRDLTPDINPVYSNYFLAYWDEELQAWNHVETTVYQEDGLISAEVPHFSQWAAGVLPERWQPSWVPPDVSAFSGAATYSYSFNIPPGRNGMQPDMTLSYSSRAIDGRILNREEGAVGDGWSLAEISVVRVGVKLEYLYETGNVGTRHPDNFRLVFNGAGYRLIPSDINATTNNTVRYYVENAPGFQVYRYYDASIGNIDGLYWIVDAPNGTRYRLGFTADSVEWNKVEASPHIKEHGHTGEWWNNSVFAWHVDTVTDTHGNRMQYDYYTSSVNDTEAGFTLTTQKNRLAKIDYNYVDRVTTLPVPINDGRLTTNPGSRIQFSPANTSRISNIAIYHGSLASPVREYALNLGAVTDSSDVDPNATVSGDNQRCSRRAVPRSTTNYVLNSITEKVGTYTLPTTSFSYTAKHHYTIEGINCFRFRYLETVDNGYGGRVSFTYAADNRSEGSYLYQAGTDKSKYPDLGFTYYVTEKWTNDGRNSAVKTTYTYTQPCYGQTNPTAGLLLCPDPAPPGGTESTSGKFGTIVGFATTTVRHFDYNASTVLSAEVLTFSQNAYPAVGSPDGLLGQLKKQEVYSGNVATLLSRVDTTYATTTFTNSTVRFTYTSQVSNYQYNGGENSTTMSSKVMYQYDTAAQLAGDNKTPGQYGNVTHVLEYDSATATTPYRTTYRHYYPNTTTWIVDKVAAESIYRADSNSPTDLLTGTWTYYDSNSSWVAMPSKGDVTRTRRIVPEAGFDCADTPSGGGTGCTYARKTADTVYAYAGTAGSYGNQTSMTTYRNYYYQTFKSNWSALNSGPLTTDDGVTTSYTYDNVYYLYPVSVTTPVGTTNFQIYGFNGVSMGSGFQKQPGLLKQVTQPNNVVTKYEYDPFGRLFAVYDGGKDAVSTSDDFKGFDNTTPLDGDPVERYRYWDNSWNSTDTFLNPAGNAPFIVTTERRPDTFQVPTSNSSSSGFAFNEQLFYDGFGRPIQTRSLWNWLHGQTKSREIITSTAYGANGQVNCQTVPYDVDYYSDRGKTWPQSPFVTDACSSKPRTTTTYDGIGRPLVVTAPDGSQTSYSYTIMNTHTVDGRSVLALTNIKDANNHIIGQATNSLGQLAFVQENKGSSSYTAESNTRYYYDLLGNLDEVKTSVPSTSDPTTWLRRSTMSYDGLGRKVSMNDADMGEWGYSYDAVGNLLTQVDQMGETLCFAYDGANRLLFKRHDADKDGCETTDTQLAQYLYYTSTNGKKGQLQEIRWTASSTDNRETFDYDTLGRLTSQTRIIGGRSYTMSYGGFDALHRPGSRTITYPNGNTEAVTVAFDHEGENTLNVSGASAALVSDVTYNSRGQLVKLGRSGATTDTIFAYHLQSDATGGGLGDSNFRLQSIEHGGSSSTIPDFKYEYDLVGNITKLTSGVDVQAFTYDDLDRLITAKATGTNTAINYDHSLTGTDYEYDKLGNIFKLGNDYAYSYSGNWNSGCGTDNPTQPMPDAVRQINSPVVSYFCYDKNGNMTKRVEGGVVYGQSFTVENELASVTVGSNITSFAYDASGQRVKTVEPGGKTTYFPFPGYAEEVNGSTVTRRVTYTIAGQAVASRVQVVGGASTFYYLYTDHLGSTVAQSNTTGTIALTPGSQTYYLPYGSYRGTPPTQTLTDRDFTGQRENREIGLMYYNARFYHPASGRFISPDFLIPSPSDPQSLNRYTYARNSPLNRVDPTGHVDCNLLGEGGDMKGCKSSKRGELAQRLAKVAYNDPLVRHSRLSEDAITSNISLILEKGEGYDLTASQMAYVLTTAQAETHMGFWMYEDIDEKTANVSYGPGTDTGEILGNTQPGDGYKYRGRGFVQLTGRANYAARGYADNPDAVADPAVAVHFLLGITTSRLDDYTDENGQVDYYNARDLVNGDKDYVGRPAGYEGTVGEYFMETAPLFEALLVEYGYGSD